jgi:hypothetical protein
VIRRVLSRLSRRAIPPAVTAQSSLTFAARAKRKRPVWSGMPAVAAPFLKAPTLKKSSGGNKYALQNKDTGVNVPETFEVSSALQKKIHVGAENRKERLISCRPPGVLAVRPSHGLDTAVACDSDFRSMTPQAHFSAPGGCLETRGRTFGDDELVLE